MSKTIEVKYNEKPCYTIAICPDFSELKERFEALNITGKKLAIITDSNVGPIYAKEVMDILESTGNKVFLHTFEAGEGNKNLSTVQDVYEFLIQNHFDRSDLLVALGGGVVGDLTGYTAATYLRGVSFIQIPTTLLSQVDSSIGGKTGVDFKSYKNMVGAFHMPKLVYTNLSTLKTLDNRQFNSGLGEIIKHGLIKDKSYYEFLKANVSKILALDYETLEKMIYISDEIKREVVEKDPTEKGDRALLNFGHTLGHAIEKYRFEDYYHGECVVLGMIAALEISRMHGYISKEECDDVVNFFKEFHFDTTVTKVLIDQVVEATKNDKKAVSGKIKFILLKEIGNAIIDLSVTEDEMSQSLKNIIL